LSEDIIVLKFGSSVLRTDADLPNAVHEIYRWFRTGYRVVAVVSAIGDTTDRLIAQARALCSPSEPFATAEHLATGERAAAALLGIALDRAGVLSRVLNPREIGLTVTGSPLDSELAGADVERLRAFLAEYPVLVVPGFFGTDVVGRTHLLGRGGSDLSAVFLSHRLGARCRLIKDVDGVYESDPAANAKSHPRRFKQLDYADALRVARQLIQPKAVSYLCEHGGCAEVAALGRSFESIVHCSSTQLAAAAPVHPLKVLLLGLGTVGFGVYQRLEASPEHFEVAGCLVRDRGKYEALGVPIDLLHTEPEHVSALQADIVIDVLPAVAPSRELVHHFLSEGAHVVSANKALIAEHGAALAAVATEQGGSLRYGAAVGGAAPMIETVDRTAATGTVSAITAVLNGTCNFVLDTCATGATLAAAISEAQALGFAEADASEDLSGHDAERKVRILCRHAFGAEPESIDIEVLDDAVALRANEIEAGSQRLRQVARATRGGGRLRAQVHFEVVEADSLFGRSSREWNALELVGSDGRAHAVTGRGAGRWPTTEAVMADLFDLYRSRADTLNRCHAAIQDPYPGVSGP
jgi:homoserine dehydrogenase